MANGKDTPRPTSLILVAGLVLLISAQTEAAVRYVKWDATGANNGTSWANAYKNLQSALTVAVSGDEIWVGAGTYVENITLKSGVALYGGFAGTETALAQRNWTLNSTVLDGNQAGSVIASPSGATVTTRIDGFRITNGSTSYGGGIYCYNSSPTIANNTIIGNTASYDGGGIYNSESSSPTVTDCSFSNNSAGRDGGGMYNDWYSSPVGTNCAFSGNSASRFGGGMYNYADSNPTLANCTFSTNSANPLYGSGGGGMSNGYSDPKLTRCTFSGNSATTNGAGMSNFSSNPTLTDCTFDGNSATQGGGMSNRSGSSPTLVNCRFIRNSATLAGGGGAGGGMYNISSSPTVTNCTFSGNLASYNVGGGMYNESSTPTVTNCTFSGNSAPYGGGSGMYNYSSAPTVTNCVFWRNAPVASQISGAGNITYCNIQGGLAGEGNIDANPRLTPDGHLRPDSPCIDAGNGQVPALLGITTDGFGQTRFIDDPATTDTGMGLPPVVDMGASEYDPQGDYDEDGLPNAQDNCPAAHNPNQADADGDGVGDACVHEPMFVDDDAPSGGDGTSWTTAVSDLQVALSFAHEGDEIWVAAGTYKPTSGEDRAASFRLINDVALYGGFAGNEDPATFNLTDRDFTTSKTILSGDIGVEGQAVDNAYHVFFHPVGTDLNNSALLDGFTINGGNANHPSDSAHQDGGGMSNYSSSPTVVNCTFRGNQAARDGGGMSNYSSSPTVVNCTFRGNQAAQDGGGMYNVYSSASTVTNCRFISNLARSGGGMYNYADSNPTLATCTFSSNLAIGIYGVGGGICSGSNSSPVATNCILWGNAASYAGFQIFGDATVTYCSVQGGWPGVGNIDVDPRLTPDGHLTAASPVSGMGADVWRDGDGDGLPDWWETMYFPSATAADPNADADGDGLTNLQEYERYSSNPIASPIYVCNNCDPSPDGTIDHPWGTIQAGLDAATNGDTVLVLAGTYSGTGNRELNYWGMSVIVRSWNGAAPSQTANATIDCGQTGRVIDPNAVWSTFAVLAGFTIANGQADFGGGVGLSHSRFMLEDCIVSNSNAATDGGGVHIDLSNAAIDSLVLGPGNTAPVGKADAGVIRFSNVNLMGDLTVAQGQMDVLSSWFYGLGSVGLADGTLLNVTGTPGAGSTVVRSRIGGTGDIWINAGQQLRIENGAVVDLSGSEPTAACDNCPESDPSTWGTITVDGTLIVSNATVKNTNVDVTLAGLEGNTDIINNDIRLVEATTGYGGQFFVEGSTRIECNHIVSEGDRYLDLDPDAGNRNLNICQNTIEVQIKQGVNSTRGTLLELRAKDYDCGAPTNPDCGSGAFPAPGSAGFTEDPSTNWVLETLEILPGAKLNLTNRAGFQFQTNTPYPETVYVRQLTLHPNAVLNTALQTLYYENLADENGAALARDPEDPSAPMANGSKIVDEPLLGFSLGIVAFNDTTLPPFNEFDIRVRQRLRDPADSQVCQCDGLCLYNNPPKDVSTCLEGSITRLTDVRDPETHDGVMEMKTQAEGKQAASSVAAKGSFARAGEENIVVAFEYLFINDGTAHDAEILVKLSDNQEVSQSNYEVGRVRPPVSGLAGSVGSTEYAVFYLEVPYEQWSQHLTKFVRGTYVELELRGKGAAVLIDNWDPQVTCSYTCADFTNNGVSEDDFLILLAEYGRSPSQTGHSCLDMWLARDWHLDISDLLSWDTYVAGGFNSCGTGGVTQSPEQVVKLSLMTTSTFSANSFVVAGKPNGSGSQQDRIYSFNSSGGQTAVQDPWSTPSASPVGYRSNGRLIRDRQSHAYQLHGTQGLIREDGVVVIPPKSRDTGGLTWESYPVSVGVTPAEAQPTVFTGVPLTDVVFDPDDPKTVYVAPVLVWVASPSHVYRAAARLKLIPQTPGPYDYTLEAIYGADPYMDGLANTTTPPEASYSVTRLREAEIDRTGDRLFVTSSRADNDNEWLLIHETATAQEHQPRVRLTDLSPSLQSPTAMLASSTSDKLYLASAEMSGTGKLHRLDIAGAAPTYDGELVLPPAAPGHVRYITAISEDPYAGRLYVLGFQMPFFGDQQTFSNTDSVFATPLLLAITPAESWSGSQVESIPISGTDLALPLSLVYLAVSPADFDADGDVDGDDLTLFELCASGPGIPRPAGCEGKDLDNDGDVDQADFARFQRCFSGKDVSAEPSCIE